MSLTTLAKVKAYLGISHTRSDSLLSALILSCDRIVKTFLAGRVLESASYTEQLDGTDYDTLKLGQYPVTSVTEVKIDINRQFGDDIPAEDLDTIGVDSEAGILYRIHCRWPPCWKGVQVKYVAGYSSIPGDVEQAANMIVADLFTRASQLAGGQSQNALTSENLGDRSEGYADEQGQYGLPKVAELLLAPYRKW